MTHITFEKDGSGSYLSFSSIGHAGYAAEGQDIVCASISSAIVMLSCILDALHIPYRAETSDESTSVKVSFPLGTSDKDAAKNDVMTGFEKHIRYIADSYPQNVKIQNGGK